MSSSTKSRRTNPSNSIWHASVAYMICMGEILRDLGITNKINMLNAGEYSKRQNIKKIVLVGSNPSQKSPNNSAFHPSTKSRQFVDGWFKGECGIDVDYMNLIDKKTKKNKQLSKSEIKAELDKIKSRFNSVLSVGFKIVACGKVAAMGLTMADIPHFEMPHPSGLCRFWNDKEAGEQKVKEMLEWIRS